MEGIEHEQIKPEKNLLKLDGDRDKFSNPIHDDRCHLKIYNGDNYSLGY